MNIAVVTVVTGLILLGSLVHGSTKMKFRTDQRALKKVSSCMIDFNCRNALHSAVMAGDLDTLKALLERPDLCSLINVPDEHGRTPLHLAVLESKLEFTIVLLEEGADPRVSDRLKMTPLHYASDIGDYEAAENLLIMGAKTYAQDNQGDTPLHIAVRANCQWIVDLLLQYDADICTNNHKLQTPLHYAAIEGNGAVIELLLEQCERKGLMTNSSLMSPLKRFMRRSMSGADGVGRFIDWNYENEMKKLAYAAKNNNHEVIKLCVECNGDDDTFNAQLQILMFTSVRAGDFDIVRALCQHANGARMKDALDRTPLHDAAEHDKSEIASILIESGADVNAKYNRGMTPLHVAAEYGNSHVLKVLLNNGASMSARTLFYETPLDLAMRNGHREAIEILSRNGERYESL